MGLFRKKDKKGLEKKDEEISFLPERDFEYVQLDKDIHDVKFETKPTTFFKDALRRFAKSKSSVVAATVLGVLVLMAIIVPLADNNSISSGMTNNIAAYLPVKWFDDANGFLDGTKNVSGVVLTASTGLPATSNSNTVIYETAGIKGIQYDEEGNVLINPETGVAYGITPTESYADATASDSPVYTNGTGGYLKAKATLGDGEYYLLSPQTSIDPSSSISFSYNLQIRDDYGDEGDKPLYTPYIFTVGDSGDYEPTYALGTASSDYATDDATMQETSISVASALSGVEDAFTCKFGFVVDNNGAFPSDDYASVYLRSVSLTIDGASDVSTSSSIASVSFTDATNIMYQATTSGGSKAIWTTSGDAEKLSLSHSLVLTGSFRYDYYEAAYCDVVSYCSYGGTYTDQEGVVHTFTESRSDYQYSYTDFQTFVQRGYIEDTFDFENPETFKLTALGEVYCPVREVLDIDVQQTVWVPDPVYTFTVVHSRYRYMYYRGYIGTCAKVSFFFGTDANGRDFFKIVFSGLLTSLELGLLATVINIVIGLIWGSISGYFGGMTDLVMERLTEIIGGMPWIVLMTLIILLLGSNFWTLLLALCLTGWIGMASLTRSQFYRYKGREYVLASRTLGASDARLIFRHILPNGIGTIVTSAVLMIPSVIFQEASIAYLLPGTLAFSGSQSFGVTLSTAQKDISQYPYMIICASVVMALIMICFNLFGNGLRDAFNPTTKGGNE